MVEIADKLHTNIFKVPLTKEQIPVQADYFHHTIFRGDQLTSSRIRGAQRLWSNSDNLRRCLAGFVAVTKD